MKKIGFLVRVLKVGFFPWWCVGVWVLKAVFRVLTRPLQWGVATLGFLINNDLGSLFPTHSSKKEYQCYECREFLKLSHKIHHVLVSGHAELKLVPALDFDIPHWLELSQWRW